MGTLVFVLAAFVALALMPPVEADNVEADLAVPTCDSSTEMKTCCNAAKDDVAKQAECLVCAAATTTVPLKDCTKCVAKNFGNALELAKCYFNASSMVSSNISIILGVVSIAIFGQ